MLHTAVLFAFLACIFGMMLGLLSARPILMAIKTPALVLEQALPLPLIFQLLFPMLKTGIPAAVQGAVFCFANIFVQTATTFSSQNFSSGNKKRCKKILHLCLIFSIFFCVVLTLPLTFWRAKACSLFSSDEAVIRLACIRIMCILLFQPICCLYEIPAGVLRGTGHSALPAFLTILGICMIRIVWIFTVVRHFHTQEILFAVFPISWVITILNDFWGTL